MTAQSTPRTTARRRITAAATLLVAAGAIAGGGLGAAPPAIADDDTFVAIAFSPDNGAHGWANNQTSEPDAVKAAEGYCKQYGGTHCYTAVVARNQCAALFASTPDQNGQSNGHKWGKPHTGVGPTPDAAQQAAIDPGGVPVEDTGIPLVIRCSTGDAGQG